MVALHIVLWNDAVILDALFSQKVCGMRLNSVRFLVLVPVMPSSANIPASIQSGFFEIYSV